MTFNYNLFMGGNKYNARTEMQYKFAQRVENQFNLICDFDTYRITRGRGWANKYGSCSASVAIRPNNIFPYGGYLCIFHPLRNYLSKKKYLSYYCERGDVLVELEDTPTKAGRIY